MDVDFCPEIFIHAVDKYVGELRAVWPSSYYKHVFLIRHHSCNVTASGLGRISKRFEFSPFKGLTVKSIDVVKGSLLISDTSVASKYQHRVYRSDIHSTMVISRLGGSNFAFLIFGNFPWELIGGLLPFKAIGGVKDVGIIKSKIGFINSSKD